MLPQRLASLLVLVSLIGATLHLFAQPADLKAFEELKTKAEKGDVESQFAIGVAYEEGQGVAKDTTEAAKWYRKAADQGYASAQFNLGVMYENGVGVNKDAAVAAKWYRKAADQEDADAQFNLGGLYDKGEGVVKDAVEAAKWFRKAADQGDVDAQFNLGVMYDKGEGVPQDFSKAADWFRRAAEQGKADAQFNIGLMYKKGEGVTKDYRKAHGWYLRAAQQGDADAQLNLGVLYFHGEGVPQDYIEAYKWLNLSAAQGEELASEARDRLVGKMSPLQIARGQELTREYKAQKESLVSDANPKQPSAGGTGFFITADGFLVTNEHVVRGATQIRLVTSAGLISARVVKVDAANDLALLKAEGRFAALPVAASRGVKMGGTVATVGFPNIGLQGFAPKLAKGEIASLSGAGDDARYFQISVPVQPGNSGGALVDERGNVVGVVSAKLSARAALAATGTLPENVNYAVKSSYLLSFLESVPEVSARLKEANAKEKKFEDVVKSAEQAAVLVLVY